MTCIKNINGIKHKKCKCGNWLKHWDKFSGHNAVYCATENYFHKDISGVHVQKSKTKTNWYIVPLFNLHRLSKIDLIITGSLINADKHETCEKDKQILKAI